ncbi:DMT family transporter [Aeromicrobium sp. CF4.19]|uniref:DMT family transporter n=1 Tax=Aeromicrobium sp. CF4.19 TaxID=3373082 RepID=UPI003EE62A0D
MQWFFLASAIATELVGTLCLRMAATTDRRAWYAGVVAGYLLAFTFLALTLDEGLGLGVAYGFWAALGIALAAVASRVLFKEPLTPLMGAGIALIVTGVLIVEIGATH